MPTGLALGLALSGLAATLAVAIARRPLWLPEGVVALVVSAALIATGALSLGSAADTIDQLAPTLWFLAALLLLADGCRRDGLFAALGAVMARGSRDSPRRLLAFVFVVATGVTVTLGLATIVL